MAGTGWMRVMGKDGGGRRMDEGGGNDGGTGQNGRGDWDDGDRGTGMMRVMGKDGGGRRMDEGDGE